MQLKTPTIFSYHPGVFPKVERYDIFDPDPLNWRLGIGLETHIAPFFLQAVCAGELSTVPPWQLPYQGAAPLRAPSAALPDHVTLYLAPSLIGFVVPAVFNSLLRSGRLGAALWCFVYENVDPASIGSDVRAAIARYAPLSHTRYPAASDRLSLFLQGEFSVSVNVGAVIGATVRDANGVSKLRLGVVTSTGFVDPIFFFDAMKNYASNPADVAAFTALVGTDWPFNSPNLLPSIGSLSTTQSTLLATKQRLYPFPILHEARNRLALTPAEWEEVGKGQKALYWSRLVVSTGNATGTPLVFNVKDMANPFQLEAVSEFYMAWPTPATPVAPPAASPPVPPIPADFGLVLQRPGWNVVIIDPFSHAHIGSPAMPDPDWRVKPHSLTGQKCTATTFANPDGTLVADGFDAVLFLVYDGEVKGWFRWSTYSSHRWEDRALLKCGFSSSVIGNTRYEFQSQTGSKKFINYAFLVWSVPTGKRTDGRHYFRTDLPDDPDGKDGIMIHFGQAVDTRHAARDYHGSAGCLVSPAFYRFRDLVIGTYQRAYRDQSGAPDPDLTPLEGAAHEASVAKWNDRNSGRPTAYPPSRWDGKISGLCWVIRPDEPTRK